MLFLLPLTHTSQYILYNIGPNQYHVSVYPKLRVWNLLFKSQMSGCNSFSKMSAV